MLHEQTQLDAHPHLQAGQAGQAEQAEHSQVDEILAARADADGYVLLYRRHLKAIYAYAYSRLANRQEAEDVASLTFERAWQSLPTYRPTGSFKGWLFTIAHRALADYYRQTQPSPVPIESATHVADSSVGPEEAALASEELRVALKVIQTLSREQQEVITLRFMGELRYSEIAQVVGKREAAVKMIAYRALQEIRKRYNDVQE